MPSEIVVSNSSDEVLPFKEAWLRGTLETIKRTGVTTEEIVTTIREAIRRSPDLPRDEDGAIVIDTDALRHAMVEALESDQPALAVTEVLRKRAEDLVKFPEVIETDLSGPDDAALEGAPPAPAQQGISAGMRIMMTQLTGMVARQDKRAALVLTAFMDIASMAANEVAAEIIEAIIAEVGEILRAPAEVIRAAQLTALAECQSGLLLWGRMAMLDRYKELFKESMGPHSNDVDAEFDQIFRRAVLSVIEELKAHGSGGGGIPYGEEIAADEEYVAVATTEREPVLAATNSGFPTRCVANSRKLTGHASALWFIAPEDRPQAVEITYQDAMLPALSARDVEEMKPVPRRWKEADRTDDLPGSHIQGVSAAVSLYSYTWTLAGETLDDSILDKLEDARKKYGDDAVDKAKKKIKEFFEKVAQDVIPAIPGAAGLVTAGKAGEAIGNLAGEGLRKIIDYVLFLLQPTTYPSYRINHLVIWPAGSAPLSMVALLKSGGSGSSMRATRLDEFMATEIAVKPAMRRSGMENFKCWLGTSRATAACPNNVFFAMQQGRQFATAKVKDAAGNTRTIRLIQTLGINGPDAVQWRSPDTGFGVVFRQNEENSSALTKVGSYLTAIRADVRKRKKGTE